jgi:hypothetical protein
MHKTFVRFNKSAQKSGLLQLNPTLAKELTDATETFSTLSKTASECEGIDEDPVDAADQSPDSAFGPPPQEEASRANPIDIGWGYTQTTEQPDIPQISAQPNNYFTNLGGNWRSSSSTSLTSQRQFTVGEVFDQTRSQSTQSQQQPFPFGLIDLQASHAPSNPQVYSVNIPTPDITLPLTRALTRPLHLPEPLSKKALPRISTYSHDETDFARRLSRATLESGFHLLSMADARPAAVNHVFKLTLKYFSLAQLRTQFQLLLSRSANEELEFVETPYIHLGGAGTHYPRKDADGNVVNKINAWTIRQLGASSNQIARVENVADGRWEVFEGIDLSGFEGEWFDSHDVQGYLEDHYNCKLDPKSSFAECLIDDDELDSAGIDEDWRPSARYISYLDISQLDAPLRRTSEEMSDSPSLAHSNTGSSTPSGSVSPPTDAFNLTEAPYDLDLSFSSTFPSADFSKFGNTDRSFDQTLGLGMAPDFAYDFNTDPNYSMVMNLGLESMGEVERLPAVRQKRKKTAWLETHKLIAGK